VTGAPGALEQAVQLAGRSKRTVGAASPQRIRSHDDRDRFAVTRDDSLLAPFDPVENLGESCTRLARRPCRHDEIVQPCTRLVSTTAVAEMFPAACLSGVVSQRLLPRVRGGIAAFEILGRTALCAASFVRQDPPGASSSIASAVARRVRDNAPTEN